MKSELIQFGHKVRELRLAAGLTQEELAARSGLHRTYLGGVERGERNVGLINIHGIATALAQPVAALFGIDSSCAETSANVAKEQREHNG